MSKNLVSLIRGLEITCLSLPACLLIIALVGFFFKIVLSAYTFPLAALCGILVSGYYFYRIKASWCLFLYYFLSLVIIVAFAYWASTHFYDFSCDSQTYHMPIAFTLASGWNPIWQPNVATYLQANLAATPFLKTIVLLLINHYAYVLELMVGSLILTTQHIINPSCIYIPLIIILFCSAYRIFYASLKRHWLAIALAFLVVVNPVAISQFATAYVDGMLGYTISWFALLAADYYFHRSRLSLLLLIPLAIFIINLKFTGLVYVGFIAAIIFLYFLISKAHVQSKQFLWVMAVAVIYGVAIFGYHPYVQNALQHKGNLFYPAIVIEHGKVENFIWTHIDPPNANPNFLAKPVLETLAISLFSQVDASVYTPALNFNPFDIHHQLAFDSRFGGFGPMFGYLFILTLISWFFVRSAFLRVLSLAVLLSCFLTSGIWWARFVPQLWCVPILVAWGLCLNPHRQGLKYVFNSVLLVTAIFNLYLLAVSINVFYIQSRTVADKFFSALQQNHVLMQFRSEDFQVTDYHTAATYFAYVMLNAQHIPVIITDKFLCKDPFILPAMWGEVRACALATSETKTKSLQLKF